MIDINLDHVKSLGLSQNLNVLYCKFRNDLQDFFIVCKCIHCGLFISEKWLSFNKINCPNCSLRNPSYRSLLERSLDKFGDKFHYLANNYKSMSSKMDISCKVCNRVFSRAPGNHLKSVGCPYCNSSEGEKRLYAYLDSRGIKFIKNYSDESLRDKNILLMDAMCFINGEMKAVEYNGIQHYKERPWTKNAERNRQKYLDTVRKDKIKEVWCKEKNIPLLVIPYWDINKMECLLDEFFTC